MEWFHSFFNLCKKNLLNLACRQLKANVVILKVRVKLDLHSKLSWQPVNHDHHHYDHGRDNYHDNHHHLMIYRHYHESS